MPKRLLAALLPLCLSFLFVLPLQSAPLPAPTRQEEPVESPQPSVPQADVPEVFGGREALPGTWPWQVALVTASQEDAFLGQYCGGTLITPEWVLTAAHCVDGFELSMLDVVLGRHHLSSDEGERVDVAQIIVHPNFNYNALSIEFDLDSDLALLRLATPSTRQPVTLYSGPAGTEESDYIGATVTGWGLTDQLIYPDALHEVVVPLVTPTACALEYGELVTENMICAGYPKGNKDSCFGDSGGPLLIHNQEEAGWQQIGIVSWGRSCGLLGSPGVYTRISNFTAWIGACLADPASHICMGSDGYEPDDRPQQATLIQSNGVSQTHQFHARTDRDWVKFEAQAGSSYRIDIQPLGAQSDPLLWLYASDGSTPLAYDDDSGISDGAHLLWHATSDTTLFVEIEDAANGKGQGTTYSVTIQQIMPTFLPIVAQ